VNVAEDLPKSFVILHRKRKTTVYLSQISSAAYSAGAETGLANEKADCRKTVCPVCGNPSVA
jgi:hypothetical protein